MEEPYVSIGAGATIVYFLFFILTPIFSWLYGKSVEKNPEKEVKGSFR